MNTQRQEQLNVDLELLESFNRAGPRYTSYPPATEFTPEFSAEDLRNEMVRTNRNHSRPFSLYLHIPFCRRLCYFCGCNTHITHNRERIRSYVDVLKKEIDLLAERMSSERKIAQLHLGGGSPSYLEPETFLELHEHIASTFSFAADAEKGIEIDPREITEAHFDAFDEAGVNRMSLGVQTFDRDVQALINREQSAAKTAKCVQWAREIDVESLNIDLIYGLPDQTLVTFEETLSRTISLSPDRLAIYSYAHVPWKKKHQRAIPEERLPGPRDKLRLIKLAIETLTRKGYRFIGLDHFAKPDDDLAIAQEEGTLQRNFQGYFTHAGTDLFGLGLTGISILNHVYAQNHKSFDEYYEAVEDGEFATCRGFTLTPDDRIRRYVIMELMCNLRCRRRDVKEKFSVDFNQYFRSELDRCERLEKQGLLERTQESIEVTDRGRLLLRNICMVFDRYTDLKQNEEGPYSKTI